MKLSDYHTKTAPRKKSPVVFNLSNEKREETYTSNIKSLGEELTDAKKELSELRPLIEHVARLEERLHNRDQQILGFKSTREQEKTLLRNAEQKTSKLQKVETELGESKKTIQSLTNQKIDIGRELKTTTDEFRNKKDEYYELSQALEKRSKERAELNSKLKTLEHEFSTLQKEYYQIKSLYSNSSKINIEDKKEIGHLKTQVDYLEVDNDSAREKISMLEKIKNKVETWASSLDRTNEESNSKLAAFEQTVQNSKEVMLNMSKQIDELMIDRKELLDAMKLYQLELKKPKYFSTEREMRKAGMPSRQSIEHRQYMGLGTPTLLKFKPKGEHK